MVEDQNCYKYYNDQNKIVYFMELNMTKVYIRGTNILLSLIFIKISIIYNL